jgi:ABC-type multidrug transport system ATPase subunit
MDYNKYEMMQKNYSQHSFSGFIWKNIEKHVLVKKVRYPALKNSNGMVKNGEFVAIMGPSGASCLFVCLIFTLI